MADQPTLLTQPFAENGDKNVIPNTTATAGAFSQDKGFPPETSLPLGAGGVAPSRQDFNGAFNMLSRLAFYQQKGWTWHFDETQDYYTGCIVIDDTDGNKYICIDDVAAGGSVPSADSTHWEIYSMGGGVPAGTILPFGGSTAPDGYLFADGSAVSRTDYADLFAVYGTTFGAGDGSTTFNIPDSAECTFVGVGTSSRAIAAHDVYTLGAFKDDQIQGHSHSMGNVGYFVYASSGGTPTGQYEVYGRTSTSDAIVSTHGTPRVGDTTHGKQLGVNVIVKY